MAGAFFLGIILKKIDYGRVKSIKFSGSKIYDFTFVKKNSNKLFFKGNKAIEKSGKLYINNLNGYVEKNKEKMFISSKLAVIFKRERKAVLSEDVNIKQQDLVLHTQKLNIDFKRNVAFNTEKNTIKMKNMETKGNSIFIKFDEETLRLRNVKTTIKR